MTLVCKKCHFLHFSIDDPITTVTAIMGSINRKLKNNQQIRRVSNVIRMKQLSLPDIALAELDDDFHLNKFVKIIKLPKGQKYTPRLMFVGVGWGSK